MSDTNEPIELFESLVKVLKYLPEEDDCDLNDSILRKHTAHKIWELSRDVMHSNHRALKNWMIEFAKKNDRIWFNNDWKWVNQ